MGKRTERDFRYCKLDDAKELTSLLDFVDGVEFGHKIMCARGDLAKQILETYEDIYNQKTRWKDYLSGWGLRYMKYGIEIAIKDKMSREKYRQYKIIASGKNNCIWLVKSGR